MESLWQPTGSMHIMKLVVYNNRYSSRQKTFKVSKNSIISKSSTNEDVETNLAMRHQLEFIQ